MNKPKIWLSSPHMGGHEQKFVNEAFETNWIAPLGPNVNGFEEDLREYVGTNAAGVFTSGTASIHLALILLGVKAGDEVLCQSFTFSATANPITYQGATPVFIDSEPETWNMDPELLEKAILDRMNSESSKENISPRGESRSEAEGRGFVKGSGKYSEDETNNSLSKSQEGHPTPRHGRGTPLKGRLPKAIIAVHLYGMPAKMKEIRAIGEKYGIPVIEDAAEALGSHINGQKCGSFGILNVLSFNGNKIITTSGGGALLGDDEELIQKARFLATQARDDAPHYQHSHIGYNYRMSNIVAGIGRGQMQVIDKRVAQRRSIHDRYFEALGKTWLEMKEISPTAGVPTHRGGESRSETEGRGVYSESDKARTSSIKSENNSEGYPPQSPLTQGGRFFENLKSESPSGIYFLKEPQTYFSNRWLTTIIVNPEETGGVTREDIRLALAEENIEARPLWKPMHAQPVFEDCPAYTNGTSDWLFEYGLCLPSGSNMSGEDLERVIRAIKKSLEVVIPDKS